MAGRLPVHLQTYDGHFEVDLESTSNQPYGAKLILLAGSVLSGFSMHPLSLLGAALQ
jgi:hypothetical protein